MDRGHGRFPRRFGGESHTWIGGKHNAPEEWMEEDDLLLENELREKVQGGQDQKRRIQGNQQRGFQNPGT